MTDRNEFEKRTQEVLEESAARLDGRTRSRLTQARHAALARLDKPSRPWLRTYLPAGAAASVAVLAVMWVGRLPMESPVGSGGPVDDIEMLADAEAPDFLDETEEIEFYEWAAGEVES